MSADLDETIASPHLCVRCGLCCNGTLFRSVAFDDPSREAVRRAGLPMADSAGRDAIVLPCPALRDHKCTIYEERPRQCAEYRCELLSRVTCGTVSLERAYDSIAEVRRLVTEISARLPDRAKPWWLWRRLISAQQRADLSWMRSYAELGRDVASLTQRLERDFWG